MKKHILLLFLLFTGFLQAQTFPTNPTPFGKISINTNVEDNAATRVLVQDATTKQANWVLKSSLVPEDYTKVVYVNNNNPNSATIFDLNNPPTVNDNLLKSDVNNLYIGLDASTWVYNATSLNYVTKTISSNTSNFNLYGTSTDAGNSKTADIERSGKIDLKGQLTVGSARLGSFINTGRHLSQFNAADQQTPLIVSGGHSTIEYFKNLLVPRYAWATGLQNPSSATIDYEPYNSYRIFFSDNAAYQKIFELSQQGNIYTKGVLSETIVAFTPTISGQPAIIKHVASVNVTQPVKLVIYFHGSGTPQLDPFTDANSKYVIDKLLSEGYIVATSQAHGNAWGNQASQDDYLALYNYIIAAYNISDVIFVGHSMGGIPSLNMIAKNTIPAVTKWYGIYPATNLSEAYFTEGFASAIETAYGFSGGANYAAATSGNDPNLYAGSVYVGKKYTMTASPGDLTIIKTTNSDLINTKFTGAGIDSYIVTASGIHGDISHFIPKHIASFIFDKVNVTNTATGTVPRFDYKNNLIASAILDDGTNINLTRNTRLTGSTPTFSLINSASSNKRWDARVSGTDYQIVESGVATRFTLLAGGGVTTTGTLTTPILNVSGSTASTITGFDASKNLVSLTTATYPNLTELSYVKGVSSSIQTQLGLKANLASPILTGDPTAPTATPGDNDTSIANTAFVNGVASSALYTPTLSNGANASAITLNRASYIKVGNLVTVSVSVNTTPTSAVNAINVVATLPFNKATVTPKDVGTGSGSDSAAVYFPVQAQIQAVNTVNLIFKTGALFPATLTAVFQYSVLE